MFPPYKILHLCAFCQHFSFHLRNLHVIIWLLMLQNKIKVCQIRALKLRFSSFLLQTNELPLLHWGKLWFFFVLPFTWRIFTYFPHSHYFVVWCSDISFWFSTKNENGPKASEKDIHYSDSSYKYVTEHGLLQSIPKLPISKAKPLKGKISYITSFLLGNAVIIK